MIRPKLDPGGLLDAKKKKEWRIACHSTIGGGANSSSINRRSSILGKIGAGAVERRRGTQSVILVFFPFRVFSSHYHRRRCEQQQPQPHPPQPPPQPPPPQPQPEQQSREDLLLVLMWMFGRKNRRKKKKPKSEMTRMRSNLPVSCVLLTYPSDVFC